MVGNGLATIDVELLGTAAEELRSVNGGNMVGPVTEKAPNAAHLL